MKKFNRTLMLIFACNSVIACVMLASLDGDLLTEHFPPVFLTGMVLGVFIVSIDVFNTIFGMPGEARKLTDMGVELGRLHEQVKNKNGWTEEELQENISKIEKGGDHA